MQAISGNQWYRRNSVDKRDLSFFLDHANRVRCGLPTICKPGPAQRAARFLYPHTRRNHETKPKTNPPGPKTQNRFGAKTAGP